MIENKKEKYEGNFIQSHSLRNGRHILQFYDCLMTMHDDCIKIATKKKKLSLKLI